MTVENVVRELRRRFDDIPSITDGHDFSAGYSRALYDMISWIRKNHHPEPEKRFEEELKEIFNGSHPEI